VDIVILNQQVKSIEPGTTGPGAGPSDAPALAKPAGQKPAAK
jgi:hypothetical protein